MNSHYFKYLLFACGLILISSSSCHKDIEPDLVPITMTGANTMGFYLDGVPVNIKGEYGGLSSQGVKYAIFEGDIISILGSGSSPQWTLSIFFPKDTMSNNNTITINNAIYRYFTIGFTDNSPLGGDEYYCDSIHTGTIKISKLDLTIISGTFEFSAINKESGKIINVTEGRFDVRRD